MPHSTITQISAHSRNPEERSLSLALTNRRPRRPPITPLPSLPSFVLPSFVSVGGGVAYFRAKAAFPNRRGERKWKEGRREGRKAGRKMGFARSVGRWASVSSTRGPAWLRNRRGHYLQGRSAHSALRPSPLHCKVCNAYIRMLTQTLTTRCHATGRMSRT